jgi:phosphoglycolate phosphatase
MESLNRRTHHDPALLKPSPYLITKAVRSLNAHQSSTALLCDSITGINGFRLSGIESLGYANKPGKYGRMTAAGAGAVISMLAELVLNCARITQSELTVSKAQLLSSYRKFIVSPT